MKITVIGYGIQGRAQALNLRDSGHNVIIGNIDDAYKEEALTDKFDVFSVENAVESADVVFVLIPDGVQDTVLKESIWPNIADNACVVFAHGYWLAFECNSLPDGLDVLMIAPRYPGEQIRKAFKNDSGVPAFVDVAQNKTGNAEQILDELTLGLGFSKGGAIPLGFKQEAEIDLMIEQFMAPLFFASVESVYKALVEKGYPEEAVCMELYFSGELGAVRTMMGRDGLYTAFQNNASPTCQYGVASSRHRVWSKELDAVLQKQLERIVSGEFSKELSSKQDSCQDVVSSFVNSDIASRIKQTEESLKKQIVKPNFFK